MDEHLFEELQEYTSLSRLRGGQGIETELNVEAESEGVGKLFIRMTDQRGKEIFTTDMSSWEEVGISRKALDRLSNGADYVYETMSIPDKPYDVRIIYGHIEPKKILQIGMSYEDDIKFLKVLQRTFIIIMGPLIFFSAFFGWFMAWRALKGVEEVTDTALEISKGDFERRVKVGAGGKEIERLAKLFNIMLDRITYLMNGMKEVTDNIAHDLKTPITRIRGNAEMYLNKSKKEDGTMDFAADTMEECDYLLQMINTMLDISEAEAGVTNLKKTEINITDVIQNAVELYRPSAEKNGVAIITEVPDKTIVHGDLQSLKRMIVNLLDNAVKYTPAEGTVTVSLSDDEDQVVISVKDTGIGISEDDLPHIFKRLYRCDTSRSQPGFGLGLSLALAIARAHAGEIAALSQRGKGSTFTVTLPR
jgi:signal transduction histidine kinase